MKIALISFTTSGRDISKELKGKLVKSYKTQETYEIVEIDKKSFDDKLSNHMSDIFNEYDAIVFISSTGIAVRLIAPYVNSKLTDPAVIVVDDLGKYTISLLSGHIGGANELSVEISDVLQNKLVVTTASDGRGIDAVDVFALRNNLYIEDMEKAKTLTALMVEGERIKLITESHISLNYEKIETVLFSDYKICFEALNDKDSTSKGIIIVSSLEDIEKYSNESEQKKPICILRPRNLNIGIGCRRGKSKTEILSAITQVFADNNLSLKSVGNIGTIDIKYDEDGIIEASKELNAEMIVFSKSELEKVASEFSGSDFVKSQVGVGSVCEPAAYLLGREMCVFKRVLNGITIAVSRSENNG